MHHVRVDRWSQGESYLHALDPRVKLVTLLVFLLVLATSPMASTMTLFGAQMLTYAALLWIAAAAARMHAGALEIRAAVVLPFSLTFAVITWIAGDPMRAVQLVTKSYLSALAVLIVVATTPIPRLLGGLESLGAPRIFILIVQFLYRYLFVISEQAQHMRLAAACRRGESKQGSSAAFHAAAGAVSVLFARSYGRAEGIHRAMISRGFDGHFRANSRFQLRAADFVFFGFSVIVISSIRLAFSTL